MKASAASNLVKKLVDNGKIPHDSGTYAIFYLEQELKRDVRRFLDEVIIESKIMALAAQMATSAVFSVNKVQLPLAG